MKYLIWVIVIILVIAGIYYFISKDTTDTEVTEEIVTEELITEENTLEDGTDQATTTTEEEVASSTADESSL